MSKPAAGAKKMNYVTQKLPMGWRRRVYLRTSGASAGRKDVVLISPEDQILRSNVEIERYAKLQKIKLDPKVFTISKAMVEDIFKKESEELLQKVQEKSSPAPVARKDDKKENPTSNKDAKARLSSGVLTESIPVNVIKKAEGKDDGNKKRGRPKGTLKVKVPRDRKSLRLSVAIQRKKSDGPKSDPKKKPKIDPPKKLAELKAKKRRHSDSSTKEEEKRSKVDTFSVVSSGRQTRNSLSSIDIPVMSPKINRHAVKKVSPDVSKGPVVVPKVNKHAVKKVGPDLPKGWKVEVHKSSGRKAIFVLQDKTRITSVRQLKNYADKKSLKIDVKSFTSYFESHGSQAASDVDAAQEKSQGKKKEEVQKKPVKDKKDETTEPTSIKAEEKEAVEIIKEEDETENLDASGAETEEEDDTVSKDEPRQRTDSGKEVSADDYDVPMDDVEMSFQTPVLAPQDPEKGDEIPEIQEEVIITPAIEETEKLHQEEVHNEVAEVMETVVEKECSAPVEEVCATSAKQDVPALQVVNSKDLDKIDLNNFKFFVLAEDDEDDELPTEEEMPVDWDPKNSRVIIIPDGEKVLADAVYTAQQMKKEVVKNEEKNEEISIEDIQADKDFDVSDEEDDGEKTLTDIDMNEEKLDAHNEEQGETTMIEAEQSLTDPIAETEPVKDAKSEESEKPIVSPYKLIYEDPMIGQDPWRLMLAAFVQSNVSGSLAPVLTYKLLQKFPSYAELLQLEDIFSLPECEVDSKVLWILNKLQRIGRRLAAGEQVEAMEQEVGVYGVDVWHIFGCKDFDIATNEYDLRAYLEWRRSCCK